MTLISDREVSSGSLLRSALPPTALVVAIDPGKAFHRVWLSTDAAGLVTEPLTVRRCGRGLRSWTGWPGSIARAGSWFSRSKRRAVCTAPGSAS